MVQEESWWKKKRVSGFYQLGLDVDKILGQASAYQKKNHALPEGQKTISCPRKLPPPPPASPSSLAKRAISVCRARAVEEKRQLGVVRLKMS